VTYTKTEPGAFWRGFPECPLWGGFYLGEAYLGPAWQGPAGAVTVSRHDKTRLLHCRSAFRARQHHRSLRSPLFLGRGGGYGYR